MTAVDLYDFEGNIPDAFAVGFTAANLNVGTTNISPNVQKIRPRSELVFRPSGAASPVQTVGIQTKSPNLIPNGAQYNAVTGQRYDYDVTSLLTVGAQYLYLPGANEVQFGVIKNLVQRTITAGLFIFTGVQAILYGSANVETGPGPFPPINVTAGIFTLGLPRRVIAAYTGDLEISLITEPSGAGKSQHSTYRAGVRQLMELDTIRNAVNLASSPYQIDFVAPNSSTDVISTDKGFETSRLTYSVQFSIKVDAFNQLAGI